MAARPATAAAEPSEAKEELRDLEVDDQTRAVDEGRDQRSGDDRGVDPEAPKRQRQDRRDGRRPEADREDRDRDDEADVRADIQKLGAAERDQGHDPAEDEPDPELLPDDPADVPERDLVERHRPDDQGDRLAADIPARPDQQRDEEAER